MEDVCGKFLKKKLVKIIDHYMILEWQINNKRDGMHFFGTCQTDKEKASFSYIYSACLLIRTDTYIKIMKTKKKK